MVANIENFKALLTKANGNKVEMQKAIKRIRLYLCSSILGRDFGESVENYLNRRPSLKEMHEWSKRIVISEDYTIVSID